MRWWLGRERHTADNVSMGKGFAQKVLARADGMIAISESTRADTVRILGLKPERIEVIYPGVAEPFFAAAPVRRAKPYIPFVGTVEPRKNLSPLLHPHRRPPPPLPDDHYPLTP